MGRNRTKIVPMRTKTAQAPFSSMEAYDAAMREENRRFQDAINTLGRRYSSVDPRSAKPWWMARVSAKFDMAERHHEALVAKIEARKPEVA